MLSRRLKNVLVLQISRGYRAHYVFSGHLRGRGIQGKWGRFQCCRYQEATELNMFYQDILGGEISRASEGGFSVADVRRLQSLMCFIRIY